MDFKKTGNRIYDIYFRFNWAGPEVYDFSRLDQLLSDYLKLDSVLCSSDESAPPAHGSPGNFR